MKKWKVKEISILIDKVLRYLKYLQGLETVKKDEKLMELVTYLNRGLFNGKSELKLDSKNFSKRKAEMKILELIFKENPEIEEISFDCMC